MVSRRRRVSKNFDDLSAYLQVYGPPEQEVTDLSKLNTSAADMYSLFCDQKEASNQAWIWVDVRDVALAHVLALVSTPSPCDAPD